MKKYIIDAETLVYLLKYCWESGYDLCWKTQKEMRATATPDMSEMIKNLDEKLDNKTNL